MRLKMENNSTEKTNNTAPVSKKSFLSKLDNFWYHYKWHTIVALFITAIITVCTLQMCQKTEYDMHFLYIGGYEIERTGADGDIPDYVETTSSLKRVSSDYDKNGEVTIILKDIYMLSEEEIKKYEASDDSPEVKYALIAENKEIMYNTLMYSDYYVCFLSPAMYEKNKIADGIHIFANLKLNVNASEDIKFYSDEAILLSSTNFYSLPGICEFPEDTLICLKNKSAVASHLNKKETEKAYSNGLEVIKKIVNY
jgi:hypothetical protein